MLVLKKPSNMDSYGAYFDGLHELLDAFEELYTEMKTGEVLKNYYSHKVRTWRKQYPKNNKKKIIKRKSMKFIMNRVALWMAYALFEMYQKNYGDEKLLKKIEALHSKCFKYNDKTTFGTSFAWLNAPSPDVSSDEEGAIAA